MDTPVWSFDPQVMHLRWLKTLTTEERSNVERQSMALMIQVLPLIESITHGEHAAWNRICVHAMYHLLAHYACACTDVPNARIQRRIRAQIIGPFALAALHDPRFDPPGNEIEDYAFDPQRQHRLWLQSLTQDAHTDVEEKALLLTQQIMPILDGEAPHTPTWAPRLRVHTTYLLLTIFVCASVGVIDDTLTPAEHKDRIQAFLIDPFYMDA